MQISLEMFPFVFVLEHTIEDFQWKVQLWRCQVYLP